jgi:hypothetical protein
MMNLAGKHRTLLACDRDGGHQVKYLHLVLHVNEDNGWSVMFDVTTAAAVKHFHELSAAVRYYEKQGE